MNANMKIAEETMSVEQNYKKSFSIRFKQDMRQNWTLYMLIIPVLLYYFIFHYRPMVGAIIAFKNYIPKKGIFGSDWVGFKHFISFFQSHYFFRVFKNTVVINVSTLIFGFPAPIILALLINEIKRQRFKKTVQTITYLPHFISLVVVAGLIKDFTADYGIINDLIAFFGGERQALLNSPSLFVPIYVLSDIWQGVGWGSIIYLAVLAAIDQELYEAAEIDGAGRWRQTLAITLPSILPTIVILLILRMGSIFNVGYEKIILLYNPLIYETADVISSFVYRRGLLEANYSFSTAVGLFNSVLNFSMLLIANSISRKVNETSLW
ncbi:MAG: sugar ABC transporter permease [Epulopiscium sp.]|nr:sugar ABC transporter permease [Candidatus Epulonipiscium sp.]